MKNTTKRILSIICAAMMVLSLAVVPAAADTDKVLNISVGSGLGVWGWTGISSSSITASTVFDEYTASTKFNFANYEANDRGYGRPVVLYFGGSAYLALAVQTNGSIKLYDTSTSNWGSTDVPAGDTLLATVTQDDWVEVSARVYTDAGATKIDWTINGTTTTVAGRKGFTAVTNVTGAPYFLLDTAVLTTMGGGGDWTADFDLGLDYINFSYKVGNAVTEINEEFDTATAVEGSFPTFSDKALYSKLSGPDFDITIVDEERPNKMLNISAANMGTWTWTQLGSSNVVGAASEEYTVSFKFNLTKYDSVAYGRPLTLYLGNNVMVALMPQGDGSLKLYDTGTDNSQSTTPLATDVLLATVNQYEWVEFAARVYNNGTTYMTEYTVNGEKVEEIATHIRNYGLTYNAAGNYGYFLLSTGCNYTTADSVDFDLLVDYVNLSYKNGETVTNVNEGFERATAGAAGAVPTVPGKVWAHAGAGRFNITVEDFASPGNYAVALSSDGNGYVQAVADDPHTDEENFEVRAGATQKVYTWAKAGYALAGYSVNGGDNVPVVVGNDGSFVLSGIAADSEIVVNFTKVETDAAPSLVYAGVPNNNSLIVSPLATNTPNTSPKITSTTNIAGAVDEYTLSYKFKFVDYKRRQPEDGGRVFASVMGNNHLQFTIDEGVGTYYLGTTGGNKADLNNSVKLGIANVGDWVTLTLHVYTSDGNVLTDVNFNGTAFDGLNVNLAGVTAPTLVNDVFTMNNIYAGWNNDAYWGIDYDLYFDDINVSYTKGGNTNNMNEDFNSASALADVNFALSLYEGTIGSSDLSSYASGVFAAITESGYNGVSALTKIGYGLASDYGIIISETALTGEMTAEDLAHYKVNTGGSSVATAFPAYAYGSDGRFAVKVLDGPESENYFAGKTVYVYVYAANANGVVYAPVNANGFLFN